MMHDSLLNFHRVFEDVLFSFSPLVNFVITGKVYCTARAVSRAQHVAINACDWFSKFSSHQMREATCVASKTSKVPTRVALLFISYSMTQVNFPGLPCFLFNNVLKVMNRTTKPKKYKSLIIGQN